MPADVTAAPPRRPSWFLLALKQVALAALIVGGMLYFGTSPRTIVYACLQHNLLAILAVLLLWRIGNGLAWPRFRELVPRCSRLPRPDQKPVNWVQKGSQEPTGPGAYAFMTLGYGLFVVILMHGNYQTKKIEGLTFASLGFDMLIALPISLFYLVEDLLGRHLIVDTRRSLPDNMGYNVGGRMILFHLSIFACIILGNLLKNAGPNAAWLMYGPILCMKHAVDFMADLKAGSRPDVSDH